MASNQILMPLPLLVSRDKILNLIDAVPFENPVAVTLTMRKRAEHDSRTISSPQQIFATSVST